MRLFAHRCKVLVIVVVEDVVVMLVVVVVEDVVVMLVVEVELVVVVVSQSLHVLAH